MAQTDTRSTCSPAERPIPARTPLAFAFAIALAAAPASLSAADAEQAFHFNRYTLALDMIPSGPVLALQLAAGEDGFLVHGLRLGRDHVEVFRMEHGEPATAIPIGHSDLPDGALAFDVDPGGDDRPGRLLILDATGILAWRPGSEIQRVVTATSLYRGSLNPSLERLPLMQDLDGDGVGDLLVADFDAWWWALGRADGSFGEARSFPLPVLMNATATHVEYRRPQVVRVDDSLVALVEGAVFQSALTSAGGSRVSDSGLADDPTYLGTGVIITDEDADQSDLEQSGIYLMDDLTGDGVPDVLIQALRSSGVFDKSSELRLHPGAVTATGLSFAPTPVSQVRSEGVQFGVTVRDLDGDGRVDLLAPSVRFTFTRVIAALFSGGFKFNLNFYRQHEDGRFAEDPDFDMSLRMAFDMGSGFVSQPVVELADLDGDGLVDLVVSGSDGELDLRHGIGGEALFDDDEERITVMVPQDGNRVQVVDLDRDGREDLVLRYGPADPEAQRSLLTILLSREP
jgi:VCBS repeat protein